MLIMPCSAAILHRRAHRIGSLYRGRDISIVMPYSTLKITGFESVAKASLVTTVGSKVLN